jgi:hypothetical protein
MRVHDGDCIRRYEPAMKGMPIAAAFPRSKRQAAVMFPKEKCRLLSARHSISAIRE